MLNKFKMINTKYRQVNVIKNKWGKIKLIKIKVINIKIINLSKKKDKK